MAPCDAKDRIREFEAALETSRQFFVLIRPHVDSKVQRMIDDALALAAADGQHPSSNPKVVAWVPLHPTQGPLWANTISSLDADRPSYPLMPLYARSVQADTRQDLRRQAFNAIEQALASPMPADTDKFGVSRSDEDAIDALVRRKIGKLEVQPLAQPKAEQPWCTHRQTHPGMSPFNPCHYCDGTATVQAGES